MFPPYPKARTGFTLIELLVVIAIVGILVGLMLPAVQKVRESAVRLKCDNNLKQIGLAWHNHHEAHGCSPSGGGSWNPSSTGDLGWAWRLLPYIEQENVFRMPWRQAGMVKVDAYLCPTRRTEQVSRLAKTDYAAFDGPLIAPGLWVSGGLVPARKPARAQFTDALAGLSNTPMVGEKMLWWSRTRHDDCNDDQGYTDGWDNDTIIDPARPGQRDTKQSTCNWKAGASHPTSFGLVFGDGSVRHSRFGISPDQAALLND